MLDRVTGEAFLAKLDAFAAELAEIRIRPSPQYDEMEGTAQRPDDAHLTGELLLHPAGGDHFVAAMGGAGHSHLQGARKR